MQPLLDTPRAFAVAVLLALLVVTSMATSTTTSKPTSTPPPPTTSTPAPVSAWQEYLRCADERHCVDHRATCDCGYLDFRCWEMCKRRCSCGCLGVPETILDHDVWDDCAEECRPYDGKAYMCIARCTNQDCRNLCRARCRCECIGSRDRNKTESNAL
ncbi:uncharacterized protein LOC113209838 [Frankliniella occidentalis]|uniref:Uncharacterized protein LOC113209838 n=1 Tax=Frankliniella occidentalis TaxID=133901 RepID=A0A6J1SR17_FRAOC|nr:uncharacterized protein LOC113209838 [Frankliniella occidentalis]